MGHAGADAGGNKGPEQASNAADRLRANKGRILSLWEERLRQTVAAAGRQPSLILINTLPAVLDQLAEALFPDHPRRTATDGSTVGQEHGGERVRLTHFRLEDLITEYKILRQVLVEVIDDNVPLAPDERHTLNTSLDQMIMEACTGYALGERIVLVAPRPVRGHVAPDALGRAVENLTSNALKYGAPSSPITLTVDETHGRGILTVHNHGPVIPPEQQETLFRAFQRLTEAETSGKSGWGLGLAQVRAVAEAHGGSIGVDSLPDHGTTFIIDIPLDARPYQDGPNTPAN